MRKQKQHIVTRGALEGRGATRAEAKANLDKQIDWACQYQPYHVESRYGSLIVIVPSCNGYSSMLISPSDIVEHSKVKTATCFVGQGNIDNEVRVMRQHAAQLAWNHNRNDADHIAASGLDETGQADLRSWIRFQRLYAEHIANGASPNDAHELACRGVPISVNPCVSAIDNAA